VNIALSLTLVVGLLFWGWYTDNSAISKFYWPAASLKLLAGLAVGFIHYRYYPQSDTIQFFNSALLMRETAMRDFAEYVTMLFSAPEGYFLGEHRTLLFTKLVSIVTLFTGPNYFLTSLFFSLLSFVSAWNLTRWIARLMPEMAAPAVVALLFFPSCVFWSSGILKESLAMTGIYYLAFLTLKAGFRYRFSAGNILLLIGSLWITWNLKYYYVIVFMPVAVALLVTLRITEKFQISFFRLCLLFAGLMFLLIPAGGLLHPNLKLDKIPAVINETRQFSIAKSDPQRSTPINDIDPAWDSLLARAPLALVTGLFAPLAPNLSKPFQVIAVFEDLVLLVLSVFAFPHLKRLKESPYRLWVIAILAYAVVLSVGIALSMPNAGTLVRYRVGYLPFFVLLIAQQTYLRKQLGRFIMLIKKD
jgi:hypothetical protein